MFGIQDRSRRIAEAFVGLVVAGSVLFVSGPAEAHREAWTTDVSILYFENNDSDDTFAGSITSPGGEACEGERTVKLFRARRGRDKLIATTTSFYLGVIGIPQGGWVIEREDPRDGRYYAKVTKKDLDPSSEHAHLCSAGKSPILKIDDNPQT